MRRFVALLVMMLTALGGVAVSPAGASVAPLSPPPTFTLSCASGVSTLTVIWQPGPYGAWVLQNSAQAVAGPAATYTTVTTQAYTVGSGWYPTNSTVRLNQDPVDTASGENQIHPEIFGAACPFNPGVSIVGNCTSHSITISIQAGRLDYWQVWDYTAGSYFGGSTGDHPVGPTVLGTVNVPVGTETVTVEVSVNGIYSSTDFTFDCTRGCVMPRSYWTSSVAIFPSTPIVVGGVTYTPAQARAQMQAPAVGYPGAMFQHLLGAKLNVLMRGANVPGLAVRIAAADAWLTTYPLGSNPQGAPRTSGFNQWRWLESFNNGHQGLAYCGSDCV